jgi:hypothetical protein
MAPVCAACGVSGACYCSVQGETGDPAGDWFHPLCFAKKGLEDSVYLYGDRRNRGSSVPHGQAGHVRKVRAQCRNAGKPVSGRVRVLPSKARRV